VIADIPGSPALCRYCRKSPKLPGANFSAEKKIRPRTAGRCGLNHVTEVASEFIFRRRGPPHLYTKIACTAKRNFDTSAKRLLQQNLPGADSCSSANWHFLGRDASCLAPSANPYLRLCFRDLETAVFGFPVVKAPLADPVLAAEIGRFHPGLVLLQDPNDLLFRMSRFIVWSFPRARLQFTLDQFKGATSQSTWVEYAVCCSFCSRIGWYLMEAVEPR
jgi:hypothetical protein